MQPIQLGSYPRHLGGANILSVTLFAVRINYLAKVMDEDVHSSLFVYDLQICYEDYVSMKFKRNCRVTLTGSMIGQIGMVSGFPFQRRVARALMPHCRTLCRGSSRWKANESQHWEWWNSSGLIGISEFHGAHTSRNLKTRAWELLHLSDPYQSECDADQDILMRTDRLIIRPKLDCGCVLYNSDSEQTLSTLNAVLNEAMRICSGAFNTIAVECLHVVICEPSLWERRQSPCRWCADASVSVQHILLESVGIVDEKRVLLQSRVTGYLTIVKLMGENSPYEIV